MSAHHHHDDDDDAAQVPLSGYHLRLLLEGSDGATDAVSVPVEAARFLSPQASTTRVYRADRDVMIRRPDAHTDAGQLDRALTHVCEYLQHELATHKSTDGPKIDARKIFPLSDASCTRDLCLVLEPADAWYAEWAAELGSLAQVQLVWGMARQLSIPGLVRLCEMQVACLLLASNREA
jgi:hypothetical protein